MRRFILLILIAAALVAGGLALTSFASRAQAQLAPGLQEVGGTIKLPSTDPRIIATRIINVSLGLIGIILVALIVYAGFLYMTSGGDSEKTKTALNYIRNAVIGLVIVLSAWAIARYVIEKLIAATTEGGGVGGAGPGPGAGGGFGAAGGAAVFKIISITPKGTVATKKIVVKIVFNKNVSEASAKTPGAVTVEKSDGAPVAGSVTVDDKVVRFAPNQTCPPPNTDRKCFDDNTDYRVKVGAALESTTGQKITCGGFAPACEAAFKSGSTVDVTPPNVSVTFPVSGQSVSADALVDVNAYATDETGISYVSFKEGTNAIGEAAAPGASPLVFDAHAEWDTAGLKPQSEHTLTATAYDVDTGVKTSDPVKVIVRPAHCFNGSQDQGETGVDCGGAVNAPDYCGACAGAACTANTQCASGVCTGGVCAEQPVITSVAPNDGAAGSYVTLKGVNFGTNGKVTFLGPPGSPGVEAKMPQACVDYGVKTWSPTEVIVEAPPGAKTGPLKLTNSASGLADATNAPPNPFINDFLVNDTLRPGICAAVPNVGVAGSLFKLVGRGFGATAAGVNFGDKLISTSSWTDGEIQALIPNVAEKAYPVTVTAAKQTSNPVGVQVIAKAGGGPPQIAEINPASGPVGAYVTLTGKNFSDSVGSVMFREVATGKAALADTNFPPACAQAFWSDTSVVVKVPPAFTQGGSGALATGAYTVQLTTSVPGAPPSNSVNFAVNTDAAPPGICGMIPSVAPVGTAVQIHGERFTSGPGKVTFYQNKNGAAAPWTNQQISSAAPAGAQTGPVTVTPASNGLASNGYKFEVRNCNEAPGICKSGEECCGNGACLAVGQCQAGVLNAMFGWRSSTGLIPRAPRVVEECKPGQSVIPSPTPWGERPGGLNACVNAPVVVRFTTKLEPASVKPPTKNLRLEECAGAVKDPCAKTAEVKLASGYPQLKAANPTQDYVVLAADGGALKPATTYRVTLGAGIKGLGPAGGNMEENAAKCGKGNSYCFTFRTKNDTQPCALGAVLVAPDPFYAHDQGEKADYGALPLAKDDACLVLLCRAYDWSWAAGDGRATVTNNPDLTLAPPKGACDQVVTAQLETGKDPVKISASTAGVAGSGDFFVNFIPPKVESYGPNCDQACVNAAVWAVFNVELDKNSVKAANAELKECTTENCLDFLSPLVLADEFVKLTPPFGTSDQRLRQITVLPVEKQGGKPVPLLKPGRYYRVTLKGGTTSGIRSKSGVPMTGLNDPAGFAWNFRTKLGDKAFCETEKVLMAPTEKYETLVGASQGFAASPFSSPDACSDKGQQLAALEGFTWASSNLKVATLFKNGLVDTGALLPAGCGNTCLWQGAAGKAGKTAQCGNGIVETTDPKYCLNPDQNGLGKSIWNQPCQLLPPDGKGGEECDDGNDEPNDACANNCLWNPVKSVNQGGTCGNGKPDIGEDCDFGQKCQGAPATSTTPNLSDCTDSAKATECIANGGTCAVRLFRGCSPTCRHLGSPAAVPPSTCGNGDVADGEDCDDGNLASGDGCSNICLHEGSSKGTYALCGNGKLEPGEACEKEANKPWPAPGCDPAACLNTGVAPCSVPGQQNCCGDGLSKEPGKDCDDGNSVNGDGCNSLCRLEGSSDKYAVPSFCSNAVKETGEQCEAPPPVTGDGLVDPFQIALVKGDDEPDKDGKMTSNITAAFSGKTGAALYGLQCGFSDERLCSADKQSYSPLSGLTSAGCCSLRPKLENVFPPNNAGASALGQPAPGDPFPSGVCRNVLINGTFNAEMDGQSLSNNFLVAKKVQGNACPSGQKDVTDAIERAPRGWKGLAWRVWRRVAGFFGIGPAYAQKWCAGTVTGSLQFKTDGTGKKTSFFFTLDSALEPLAEYRVRFLGDTSTSTEPLADNNVEANRWGVKTKKGTVAMNDAGDSGPLTWHFTTGNKICSINNLKVRDLTLEHPYFYAQSGESHPFAAYAQSLQNGIPTPLSPVGEYKWEWQNWVFSNPNIIEIKPPTLDPNDPSIKLSAFSKEVAAKKVSGAGYLSARLRIVNDKVNVPPTADSVIQGTAHLTVNLCENPWPSISSAPFRDTDDSPDLKGTPFEKGPFYNFSVTYCRDAGEPGPNGDLPGVLINPAPPNDVDAAQGIVRQYLFTFREQNLQKDAIGLRVAVNPFHLSPLEWYRSKGFKGNPRSIKADGYEAIEDGRTVYVSAANTNGPDAGGKSSDLYSNIYLISYNDGAEAITRQIYDALLKLFSFNVNVQYDVAGACEDQNGSLESGLDGLPVQCSADWECDKPGSKKRCANFKGKLQRDLTRLSDFQALSKSLKAVKDGGSKKYPRLAGGSYLPGLTTSLWPSWTQTFGQELGTPPPKDPVNRFVTCGRCGLNKTACVADADCPGKSEACVAEGGFDPATCWNDQKKEYKCPFDPAEGPKSRLYQYRSLQAGERYELASDFEIPPPDPSDLGKNWWQPKIFEEKKECDTPATKGNFCMKDADCRVCPLGICARCDGGANKDKPCVKDADCPSAVCKDVVPVVPNACLPTGGQFRYVNVCGGYAVGLTGNCGDGVVDVDPAHTSCLGGTNDGKKCATNADCAGGSCSPNEICELLGPTAKKYASCVTADNKQGQKVQACLNCRGYMDDSKQPGCFALKDCGNGKVDGVCSNDLTRFCAGEADCKKNDGPCEKQSGQTQGACKASKKVCAADADCITSYGACEKEVCDDGKLNGTSGHCNAKCSGFGAYCGDGQVSPGEVCDNGPSNGTSGNGDYCGSGCDLAQSCNLTCGGQSYHCGDSIVTAPEICDGNTQSMPKGICLYGTKDQEPCDSSADCPGGGICGPVSLEACQPQSACAGAGGICSNDGSKSCLTNAECGAGTCKKTAGEICQPDSNKQDVKNCGNQNQCLGPYPYVRTRACNPPGTPNACTYQTWSACHPAAWCGNGSVDSGEECDDGNADDTDACTGVCKKNVCGDARLFKGVEECDMGAGNGVACTNAEYGSTCSSCSKSCKLQLTQGGYCGDGVKNPGSPEQCDGADGVSSSLTCKGLGYDYAKKHKRVRGLNITQKGCQLYTKGTWSHAAKNSPVAAANAPVRIAAQGQPGQPGGTPPQTSQFDVCMTLTGSFQDIPSCLDDEEILKQIGKTAVCPGPVAAEFSDDKIECSSTCGFGGCAYCGSSPGTGHVEGYLKDSLFQQPVPKARVTLFYKGLQVAMTTSDDAGRFEFSGLDTHPGCDQYKMVVDMYKDNPLTSNPLTPNFDESKRGGYLPVKIGPFQPTNKSLINVTVSAKQGQVKFLGGSGGGGTGNDPGSCTNCAVEINMVPKLGPNEYIAQFWWDPIPGDPNGVGKTILDYQKFGTCKVSGEKCQVDPNLPLGTVCPGGDAQNTCDTNNKGAFLNDRLNDYHDLVIRLPFTYTPGNYASCSLTPKPKEFTLGSGDWCFNQTNGVFTPECSSVDYGGKTGDNDERFNFIISGMAKCTNKVRATAGRTCVEVDLDGNPVKTYPDYGCSSAWDCENPAKYNLKVSKDGNAWRCSGKPEPSRSGSPSVLQGSAGAYLFCFHPEDPNKGSDCKNFIVPPQSAFVSGKGGQYDVIISQFNMLAGGAYGPERVINWLYDHNAEVRLYDKDGLYNVWNYKSVNPKKVSWPPEYSGATDVVCPNKGDSGDSTTFPPPGGVGSGIKGAVKYPTDAGWLPNQYKALYMTFADGVNQSWAPFSIDTSSKTVKEWNSGSQHAAYRYFADIYTYDAIGQFGAGDGVCWYHTCTFTTYPDVCENNTNKKCKKDGDCPGSACKLSQYPPKDLYLCNGEKYTGSTDAPACDQTTMDNCPPTKKCGQEFNASVKCVQFCANPKGKDSACKGTVAGTSGQAEVEAFCGGTTSCGSSDSDLFR